MIRRPPRSTRVRSSAASDVYKRQVLADDDVRGHLAPGGGDLHVLLLEDELAGLVADGGRPDLPGDFVVGMNAGPGPAALEGEAADAVAGKAERVHRRARGPAFIPTTRSPG